MLKEFLFRHTTLADLRAVRRLDPSVQAAIAHDVARFIRIANVSAAMLPVFLNVARLDRHDTLHAGAASKSDPAWASAALRESWCIGKLRSWDDVTREVEAFAFDPEHQYWFNKRSTPQRPSNDEAVLELLKRALLAMHPDKFVDSLDAELAAQPRLSTLNTILGKEGSDRFNAVKFDDLVERISTLEEVGLIHKVVSVLGDDGVLISLFMAAMYVKHGAGSRQVRDRAEVLLGRLGGRAQ
jgi:hypothetical protein